MARRRKDGATERQHAESFQKQTGITPPELNVPELPPDLEHVWRWFLELHGRRSGNGFGANPLAWTDLLAWVQLMRPMATTSELRVITLLDYEWMASQAEVVVSKSKKPREPMPPPRAAR